MNRNTPAGSADPYKSDDGAAPLAKLTAPFGLRDVILIVVAAVGWSLFTYSFATTADERAERRLVAYTEEVLNSFFDSAAYGAYRDLAVELQPWWDEIRPLQAEILQAPGEDAKRALIAKRDASLVAFVKSRNLQDPTRLLVGYFDRFNRCLIGELCDPTILRQSVEIDVKLIYRTFGPYIRDVRANGEGRDRTFGKDLEELYLRFIG